MVKLVETCLNIFLRHGLSSTQFRDSFAGAKHDLLVNEANSIAIVTQVLRLMDSQPDATSLFGLLLDEARMGIENDSSYGDAFLENAEKAIRAHFTTDDFEPQHHHKIASLYRRAGLPVPDVLMPDPRADSAAVGMAMPDMEGVLAGLAAEVEASGGGPYELFNGIDEMTAGMPEHAKASFVHHLMSFDNPYMERCALYWLVSGAEPTREAVAAALKEKLARGNLRPDTLFYLPVIRGWLPANAARSMIDDICKLALRRNLGAASNQHTLDPDVSEILSTTADGVGAQGLTIVGKLHSRIYVAMILLKTGYGIKDAFVIRCRSKREANSFISRSREEANSVRIDRMTAELLLEAALADGMENNHPPAPGFIDVMEAFGSGHLRPQKIDLQALLEHVDPQNEILNATAAELDRILRNVSALDSLIPFTDCWFEDTSETRSIIQKSRSVRTIERKIWAYLERRRDIWARRFLQTAIILKSAGKERTSKTLAASAFALMHNHSLADIPLMEDIVMTTLDAGGVIPW